MKLIEILFTLSSTTALLASVPQVVQLWRTKASDELSFSTWSFWLGTQAVNLTYMIALGNHLLMFFSAAWLTFYIVMMVLIVRYRRSQLVVAQEAIETAKQ